MKKITLLFVLAVSLGWNISAQQSHKHAISLGPCVLIGIAANYEYMLFPNFSMVMDAGIHYSPAFEPSYNASVHARWFPISNSKGKVFGFFVSGGLGFGGVWTPDAVEGLVLTASAGYKFGAGRRKGFIFTPSLDFNVILGEKRHYDENANKNVSEFGVGWSPNFKLLFGIAF